MGRKPNPENIVPGTTTLRLRDMTEVEDTTRNLPDQAAPTASGINDNSSESENWIQRDGQRTLRITNMQDSTDFQSEDINDAVYLHAVPQYVPPQPDTTISTVFQGLDPSRHNNARANAIESELRLQSPQHHWPHTQRGLEDRLGVSRELLEQGYQWRPPQASYSQRVPSHISSPPYTQHPRPEERDRPYMALVNPPFMMPSVAMPGMDTSQASQWTSSSSTGTGPSMHPTPASATSGYPYRVRSHSIPYNTSARLGFATPSWSDPVGQDRSNAESAHTRMQARQAGRLASRDAPANFAQRQSHVRPYPIVGNTMPRDGFMSQVPGRELTGRDIARRRNFDYYQRQRRLEGEGHPRYQSSDEQNLMRTAISNVPYAAEAKNKINANVAHAITAGMKLKGSVQGLLGVTNPQARADTNQAATSSSQAGTTTSPISGNTTAGTSSKIRPGDAPPPPDGDQVLSGEVYEELAVHWAALNRVMNALDFQRMFFDPDGSRAASEAEHEPEGDEGYESEGPADDTNTPDVPQA